jgi:hypothetical protein
MPHHTDTVGAITEIKAKEAALHRKLGRLKQDKLRLAQKTLLTCRECRRRSPLSSWSFIQGHYYVPPEGCTGGAYWTVTEHPLCHLRCSRCRKLNYIYIHPNKNVVLHFIDELKPFDWKKIFKAVEDAYER